ncbi:tRNA (adenine(58)-N(1))-methyltransferase, mitochondrial [Rhinoderma darwinii]|uniref:tRNA (adenine(58)-N(1))-methyltransferase, mitochondrial n=1 Tax=Rhinoderma darwinii TaxID=43563 RepID=UPI003F66B9C9
MSALCAGSRLCCAALWCRSPPAVCATNLLTRRIPGQVQHCINCSSNSREGQGGGGEPEAPQSSSPLGIRTWRRSSLSPLDRVSRLIPPEFISQEVRDLQNVEQLRPPSSSQDPLSPPELPSSSQDHLSPPELPSSSQDHLSPPELPSSSQDHLSPPELPSSSQDRLSPPELPSSSQDRLSPPELPSSSQDYLSPPELPSSSQDRLSPPERPSSSQDHLSPPELPSSSQVNLCPPSSSHGYLSPPEHPSSPQDHTEHLSPPSSSQNHLEHPRPPGPQSSLQESGPHGSLKQRRSPEPSASIGTNNAHSDPYIPPESSPPQNPASLLGTPFQPEDLLMAEFKRRHYSMFRKMFVLKKSGKLVSNWGAINNKDMLGKLPGEKIRTSTGHQFLLRRPSLDEYVMYMKRGPTISYPKDIASMLVMMDVNPGDVILEAGSGSGALSLFLSRAVGPEGRVHSIEVRPDHHLVSKRNFLKWVKAWEIRSGRCWPDNVTFINKDVVVAMSDLRSVAFDAVALDMLNPQVALPAIIGNLKRGAVCAVYITNITQVIDLLEGIRCCALPLLCEKVMEIGVTDWLVAPSLRKDGRISKRVEPQWNWTSENQTQEQANDDDDDDESQTDDDEFVIGSQPFGKVPYIARPMPWQIGHTAFLVQLRKFSPAADHTEPGERSGCRGHHI